MSGDPAQLAAAVCVAIVFAVAGLFHLTRRSELRAAMHRHGVLPRRAVGPVAVACVLVEIVVPLLAAAWMWAGGSSLWMFFSVLAFGCAGGFTVYTWMALRSGNGGPCGCGPGGLEVSGELVVRNVVLTLLCLGLVVAPRDSAVAGEAIVVAAVAVLAGVVLALILLTVPAAMEISRRLFDERSAESQFRRIRTVRSEP